MFPICVRKKGVWPFSFRCHSVMSCFAEGLQFEKQFSKIYARKYVLFMFLVYGCFGLVVSGVRGGTVLGCDGWFLRGRNKL